MRLNCLFTKIFVLYEDRFVEMCLSLAEIDRLAVFLLAYL